MFLLFCLHEDLNLDECSHLVRIHKAKYIP
jgi:hypothetical protein